MSSSYSVRARLPINSYSMGGGRRHSSVKRDSIKFTLTKAEGGCVLSGALPSPVAIKEAYKPTDNFDNIVTFVKEPVPVLYTNRPFVTINEPCDPPERNHLNQIPGSVVPSQFVPLLSQALLKLNARRGKLTRKRLLRHMRFIGRVEESSSLNNPTPIATLRVGEAICNYHCELVDQNGNRTTPEKLRLTAGTDLYITLPAEVNGQLTEDEYCITSIDPAPLYHGSSAADLSELARAVLLFLQQAIDIVRKDENDKLLPATVQHAENFAWTFGDDAIDIHPTTAKVMCPYSFDPNAVVQLQDVYDKLVDIVIEKIRVIGQQNPNGLKDDDKPASFKFGGTDATNHTAEDAYAKLSQLARANYSAYKDVLQEDFAPVCEQSNFDHFLGINSHAKDDIKAAQRWQRFTGHIEAGLFPLYRAIREIKSYTHEAVRSELMCKRANRGNGGRSDLYLGRLVMIEKDGSITVLQH